MPEIALFEPALGVEGPVLTLNADGTPTTVLVRLTDGLLWMPEGAAALPLKAHFVQPQSLVILRSTFDPPVAFAGGMLLLASIELRFRVKASQVGPSTLDRTAANPIEAFGRVNLAGPPIAALGVPDGQIGLALGYRFQAGGRSGFTLQIDPVPLEVPRAFVTIKAGALSVDLLPDEAAFVLTIAGEATLKAAIKDKIIDVVGRVFGPDALQSLDPKFHYRQKFRLGAGGLPGAPLDLPLITLLSDWSGAAPPPIPDLPEGLRAALGDPLFSFRLPDLATPLPSIDDLNISFTLDNSTLRFPDLAGLESFALVGHLRFVDGARPGEWSFAFEPVTADLLALPEILRFFLAQLTWLRGELPDLFDFEALLRLTQAEFEWFELLRNLLPDADQLRDLPNFIETILLPAFGNILDAAIAASISAERLFNLAFRALSEIGDALFPRLWELWFTLPDATSRVVDLLLATISQLAPPDLYALLGALLRCQALDLPSLLHGLLDFGSVRLDQAVLLLRLWLPTMTLAAGIIDPERLAQALCDILLNATGPLAQVLSLADLGLPEVAAAIRLPALQLPAGVLFTGLGLQAIVIHSNLSTDLLRFPATQEFFRGALDPLVQLIRRLFVQSAMPPLDDKMALRLLNALLNNAEGDERAELLLLQLGRIFPLGILLALTAAVANLVTRPAPWWSLVFKSIEEQPNLKVRRLPAPNDSSEKPLVKYLIFSDLHRDDATDRRPLFEVGSIDHFLANQELYCEVLDYARDSGYVVLEAGDCEELWFIRDFSAYVPPADKIDQIRATHAAVYDRLAELHRQHRYFRLYGNHDSYLREPEVFARLEAVFPPAENTDGTTRAFEIYDFFIIDGVKTMDEHGALDLLGDIWAGITTERDSTIRALITRVLEGRLGLDSTPYTNKKPLIVTHGHQWDFWNCDPNNLAGKLIANSIAVPLDGLDDPFIDLGGIALNGSPMIDFANGLAALPVLSNFPSYHPARAFANSMQQRADKTRLLIDDEMYLESLPALISLFAMPLSITDERGEVSWSDEPKTLENIGKIFDHLFNMICVGHTHYPQSQPYFNVEKLFLGPLADLLNLIREAVADTLFGFTPSLNVKTRYFNSGTVGWMEGVIWAIEISGAGQARLVYWTRDTRPNRPQTMDWELPVMEPALRQALDAKRDELIAYLERQFNLFRTSQEEFGALLSGGGVSFDTLLVFAGDADFTLALVEPERAGASLDDVLGQVRAQVGQVALVLLQVFAAMLRAQVSGQPGPGRRFTISAPLPGDIEAQLERITSALDGLPNVSPERLPQLACAWLFGSCGSQFIGGTVNKFNPAPSGPRQDYPVLWSLLALVPLLPSIDENALFSATVSFSNGSLNVEITVS